MKFFKQIFKFSKQQENLDFFDTRNQKLFTPLAYTGIIGLSIFTIIDFAFGMTYIAMLNIPSLISMIVGLICFKRKMHLLIYAPLVLGAAFVAISIQHYLAPPEIQSNLMWFPILTLISFYFLPAFYAPFILLVALGTALIGHLLPTFSMFDSIVTYESSQVINIVNISSIVISTLAALIMGIKISMEDAKNFTELSKRNNSLLDLNETNTALLSILSHDMNNYISIIKMHNKMLIKKFGAEESAKKHFDKIISGVSHIQELTDQVKTMRATDSGKLSIEIKPVKIKPLILKAIENFKEKIEKKNIIINFLTNVPDDTEVLAEAVSLQSSVISNLISNAIKFSNEHSAITIILGKYDDKVQLTVKDAGVGIPGDILKNIFSKTAATTRAGTSGEKGTGFGMPILKMYLDKYGAIVKVNSTTEGPFKGTEFIINFNESTKKTA